MTHFWPNPPPGKIQQGSGVTQQFHDLAWAGLAWPRRHPLCTLRQGIVLSLPMVGEVVTGFCLFDIRGSEISIQSFLGVSGIRSCSHTISRRRKTAGTNAKCHPRPPLRVHWAPGVSSVWRPVSCQCLDSFSKGKSINVDHLRIVVVIETTGRPAYLGAHNVCS